LQKRKLGRKWVSANTSSGKKRREKKRKSCIRKIGGGSKEKGHRQKNARKLSKKKTKEKFLGVGGPSEKTTRNRKRREPNAGFAGPKASNILQGPANPQKGEKGAWAKPGAERAWVTQTRGLKQQRKKGP